MVTQKDESESTMTVFAQRLPQPQVVSIKNSGATLPKMQRSTKRKYPIQPPLNAPQSYFNQQSTSQHMLYASRSSVSTATFQTPSASHRRFNTAAFLAVTFHRPILPYKHTPHLFRRKLHVPAHGVLPLPSPLNMPNIIPLSIYPSTLHAQKFAPASVSRPCAHHRGDNFPPNTLPKSPTLKVFHVVKPLGSPYLYPAPHRSNRLNNNLTSGSGHHPTTNYRHKVRVRFLEACAFKPKREALSRNLLVPPQDRWRQKYLKPLRPLRCSWRLNASACPLRPITNLSADTVTCGT